MLSIHHMLIHCAKQVNFVSEVSNNTVLSFQVNSLLLWFQKQSPSEDKKLMPPPPVLVGSELALVSICDVKVKHCILIKHEISPKKSLLSLCCSF